MKKSKNAIAATPDLRVNLDARTLTADGRTYGLTELKPKSTKYADRFTIVFQRFCDQMVADPVPNAAFQVFFWSFRALDHKVYRPVYQDQLVDELGLSQATISRSLNQLTGRGWFERKRDGRTWVYRLSLECSWRGSAAGWHAQKRAIEAGHDVPSEPTSDELNSAATVVATRGGRADLSDIIDEAVNAGVNKVAPKK